jgi:hypothetical protein
MSEREIPFRKTKKEARRVEAKEHKTNAQTRIAGEDADIAGIVPGPQTLPGQWDYNSDNIKSRSSTS